MAKFDKQVASSRKGYTWRIYAYKPQMRGAVPYMTGTEGIVSVSEYEGREYESFRTVYPGSRHLPRIAIPGGRMTAKAIAMAEAEMDAYMRENGLMREGDYDRVSDKEADAMPA